MPIELTQARQDHPIRALLKSVINSDYSYLNQMQPALDLRIVLATPDKPGIPAVKLHGYPCIATIGKVAYKDRIRGAGDAVLTIDTAEWNDLLPEERVATLAHELEHLDFPGMRQLGEHWVPKLDQAERPVIAIKLHDIVVGGFTKIVQQYGDHAIEKQSLDRANSAIRQMALPFDQEESEEPADTVTFRTRTSPWTKRPGCGTFGRLRSTNCSLERRWRRRRKAARRAPRDSWL